MTLGLDPATTVHLAIDWQNVFCSPSKWDTEKIVQAQKNTEKLIEKLSRKSLMTIPIKMKRRKGNEENQYISDEFSIAALKECNIYLEKQSPSAFATPELHEKLERLGKKVLLVTGVYTSACVRATVDDAIREGYKIVLPADTTANSVFFSASYRDTIASLQTNEQVTVVDTYKNLAF